MADVGVPVKRWIEENESSFKPPVCNKLMYGKGTQHKVMFVGGPNVRKDYHMNEGEELFLQLKGNIVLKVMEKGKPKDIHIRQGQMFLLPGGVPHSPNRPEEGSIGLVIERERLEDETDGVRWYVDDSNEKVLYERWFHCTDLGTQLAPVIKGYFDSEEFKTRVPSADIGPPKFELNTTSECAEPFNFEARLAAEEEALRAGPVTLFDGEFKVAVYGSAGEFALATDRETFVWALAGEAVVSTSDGDKKLASDACHVFPDVKGFASRSPGARLLVCQSTKRNPFTHPKTA